MSRCDLDLWHDDLKILWYIKRHVLKICTKCEQNRAIPGWIIDKYMKVVRPRYRSEDLKLYTRELSFFLFLSILRTQQPRSGWQSKVFQRFGRIGKASTIGIGPSHLAQPSPLGRFPITGAARHGQEGGGALAPWKCANGYLQPQSGISNCICCRPK